MLTFQQCDSQQVGAGCFCSNPAAPSAKAQIADHVQIAFSVPAAREASLTSPVIKALQVWKGCFKMVALRAGL